MQRILNAFMLHGLPLAKICRIARKSGCAGLSLEPSQLDYPELDDLLRRNNLSLTAVGAVFLSVDQTDFSALECLLQTASAHHVPTVFCVLHSGSGSGDHALLRAQDLCSRLHTLGERYGICICLEPLSSAMSHISPLCDPVQLLSLCRGKDPRWFGWTLDLCHCAHWSFGSPVLKQLAPYLRTVHLADLSDSSINQDDRLFPEEGSLPLFDLFGQLRALGFDGPVELEVISSAIAAMPDEILTKKIGRSFLCTSNCFAAGELAVHQFLGTDWDFSAVGGSAGMVSTQLQELGIQPMLAGLCGSDESGRWLCENTRSIAFEVLCQPNRDTSLVQLKSDKPDQPEIQPGNTDVSLLAAVIDRMPNTDAWFYLPVFPGYETLEAVSRNKTRWKRILDFGFYQWCGNYEILLSQLHRNAPGFCALINAKNMSQQQKLRLGAAFIRHGYQYAILTDRAKPVWLISAGECKKFPIQPAHPLRDTCGAGDCMVAGIMASLSRGGSMEDALTYGMTVSKNKVQTYGIWRASNHGRSNDQPE